ncbi:hypothetical protein IB244_28565 [Rhizobium sp. RHZ02]|nr:hypothetical protein [Rhizobium sp. RHZ02]
MNRRHRLVAWIRPATMGELVTPARRQLEHVAIRLTGQVSRQIEKLLRDEMHDIPFPPDLAVDCHHRRSQHYAPALLEAASTTTFARPPRPRWSRT